MTKHPSNLRPEVPTQGYLLLDKPKGKTAFHLVAVLRKRLGVKKIGHAGTLDPLATGVMVMLIGREFTKLSDRFLCEDKEYLAEVHLGIETDSYDAEGNPVANSPLIPTREEVENAIAKFQGSIDQLPPMFSAKKVNGQKLYHLARQGKVIERKTAAVTLHIELLSYSYPLLNLRVSCSKGTYIRSLAHDLGKELECGAHLSALIRTRSGCFQLSDCLSSTLLYDDHCDLRPYIQSNCSAFLAPASNLPVADLAIEATG